MTETSAKKTKLVFLTGATGNMGCEALDQLLSTDHQVHVRILVLPSEKNHPRLRSWRGHRRVSISVGDLTRYEDVLAGVTGADYVLHVGGMVSPAADRLPELTRNVNVGGAANIVRAIKAQTNRDDIKLVYIGTVAQTGSRMAPIHWGRTGDPIKISHFDHYAVTKTEAEAIVAESGLRYWVSLRQSGMAHVDMWKIFDPIMFHNPINGVFEWSTAKDSGRLMANICRPEVPDRLWRKFYNIGGGEACRVINHEFIIMTFRAMGVDNYRSILSPHWIATQNFHGQWYSDSDRLEALVPFRSQSLKAFLREYAAAIPWYVKLAGRFAPGAIRKRIEKLAKSEGGPLAWMSDDNQAHIDAYFGSREAWEALPRTWEAYELSQPAREPSFLDHGYDETLPAEAWDLPLLQEAAKFRGGECLAETVDGPFQPVSWRCPLGHDFEMTPNLMLRGGHWCPACMTDPSSYDKVADHSPFFRQVWNGA